MRNIYINGRFLSQQISGVQRFARELVMALNDHVTSANLTDADRRWFLVRPGPVDSGFSTPNIEQIVRSNTHPVLWDQVVFPRVAKDGIAVSLGNVGPVFRKAALTVIHDAAVYQTPHNYALRYRLFHQQLGRLIAKRSHVATVSEFSRQELAGAFGMDADRIAVIPNGCDHLDTITPQPDVLARLGVAGKKFFLCVGGRSINKNTDRAIAAFQQLDRADVSLVVVGGAPTPVFAGTGKVAAANVILAPRVTDAELLALYDAAVALVFPSLYEGFGIPPLEAMRRGCAVLASDIAPIREVCSHAACYFDPSEVGQIADAMSDSLRRCRLGGSEVTVAATEAICNQYLWAKSARALIRAVDQVARYQDR